MFTTEAQRHGEKKTKAERRVCGCIVFLPVEVAEATELAADGERREKDKHKVPRQWVAEGFEAGLRGSRAVEEAGGKVSDVLVFSVSLCLCGA